MPISDSTVVPTPVRALKHPLHINLWQAKDDSIEASVFTSRDDALDEIGAEYPGMTYAGTITVPVVGSDAEIADWSAEAHRRAVDATADWLEEQAARRSHRDKVL